ncbi:ATP-binding protein [Neobacillus massiliamazoniensis]|uniref:ORC1/DEAH AAA+ ATPase domain-containing protein n=1 Tax=Neobacillus massiliamazoniensis TaxID=1499688 RepID=A0A0U1P5B6_9BACI|nr:ATP-binding protein [Neobacillus massiliamazoniensis]CRK85222.1 hypothetical protein BN000_05294 [Neobacillus massiliamazoniensis]
MKDKILIEHESFNKGIELIEYCYSHSGTTLLITGESGVGKSTLIDGSINQLEKIDTSRATLFARFSKPVNKGGLLRILLRAVGDTRYADRTSHLKKIERLVEFIINAGIKMIVLDDFQVLVERGNPINDIIYILKEILIRTGTSLVIVGLPNINSSKVLNVKFDNSLYFNQLSYKTKKDVATFKSILMDVEKKLEFKKPSNLSNLSNEIFIVTEGNFAQLMKLISGAANMARTNQDSNITRKHIFTSYDKMYYKPKSIANPF